jgi:hypothetical protein
LQRIALPLVALVACGSCGGLGNTSDAGSRQDVALGPVISLGDVAGATPGSVDVGDAPGTIPGSAVDAGTDLTPRCCSEVLFLSPVSPDAPCSFSIPAPPPTAADQVLIYVNKILMSQYDVDGGYSYSVDPTTSTLVFAGELCDRIMASPEDYVVNMLCSCWHPCWGCMLP